MINFDKKTMVNNNSKKIIKGKKNKNGEKMIFEYNNFGRWFKYNMNIVRNFVQKIFKDFIEMF